MKGINELRNKINEFLNSYEMHNFEVSPDVKELIKLVSSNNNPEETIDDYLIIGSAYKKMGRFSLAAVYHEKALDNMIAIKAIDGLKQLFNDILKERNYYVNDDAKDILNKVKNSGLLDEKVVKGTYKNALAVRRSLKHDPIEMSEEYLAVIDEVEEKVVKNKKYFGMGSCHESWDLKHRFLLEKGINWKSPSILNPRVIFD